MSNNSHDDVRGHEESISGALSISGPEGPAAKRKRSPSPGKCRDFIRRQTADAMPAIVNTFVGQAREGSVPHFNALTKVGGFDQHPAKPEAPKRRRKSLARQLLDEVEKYEAKQAAELAKASNAISPIDHSTDNRGTQEKS